MNIMILTNLFAPYTRGGAERIVEKQAGMLAGEGHNVLVLTTAPDHDADLQILPSGVMVRRYKPRNLYFSLQDTFQPLWKRALWHLIDLKSHEAEQVLERVFLDAAPDIIITHNMKGFGLSAFRAINKAGLKHIHVLHDLQLIVPSGLKIWGSEGSWMVSGRLQKRYVEAVKCQVGSPTLVVSPSQFLLDEHARAGLFIGSKTALLPNPVSWDDIAARPDKIPQTTLPLLVFAGQLEPHKGVQVLMDAWPDDGRAQLVIAGSGSLSGVVERFAASKKYVTAVGRLSPSRVRAFLHEARAVLVPSLCYENAPNIILEAFSEGTPVIASKIGGIQELVLDVNGILFGPGDVYALRDAMQKELAKPLDREIIKQSAQRFSSEVYKKQLLALIGTLRPKG
ncbi:MAG: Glycosyltransferase [Parcubacteria group bacterium GW2011_GWA2_56_7]|nr:MAG: Glycosyltransferase [Parcubacteria group bacterium GW2011_GWA2_56_7]